MNEFLKKIDSIVPNPWYVDGVEQARPITQFGFILGVLVILTLIVINLL